MLGNEDVIRQRIRELRQDAELSQEKLGEYLHVDGNQIYLWESGKRNISERSLRKYADYFDYSLEYLKGNTYIPNPRIEHEVAEKMVEHALSLVGDIIRFKIEDGKIVWDYRLTDVIEHVCREVFRCCGIPSADMLSLCSKIRDICKAKDDSLPDWVNGEELPF